jgi:hypothetical protein
MQPYPEDRAKGSATLPSLATQPFASFQSQASSSPLPFTVQPSPIRRKPLPLESPVVSNFAQSQARPSTLEEQGTIVPQQGPRQLDGPIEDDELFVPRNLDAYARNTHPSKPPTNAPIEILTGRLLFYLNILYLTKREARPRGMIARSAPFTQT